ncbi:MAG: hypothetical protein ACJ74U_10430 [Jatrophihabitantaceae bacterium]
MRKIVVILASLLPAIAVTVANAAPASAFGSERLGCYVTPNRTVPPPVSSQCSTGMTASSYTATFEVLNESGSYSYTWSVPAPYTSTISRGCGTGDDVCVLSNLSASSEVTVSVTIRQNGHSATLHATAYTPPL